MVDSAGARVVSTGGTVVSTGAAVVSVGKACFGGQKVNLYPDLYPGADRHVNVLVWSS